MRKFLLGLFLGLLAVVHSTPVTTVTKVPVSNEDEVFREAMTDGFLVPSLSTETPKTQSTIEASQQTESTSSADDVSRDFLLTTEAPKTNATVPASQQPDSEELKGSAVVADNFWHGGYTTMTSMQEASSATKSTTSKFDPTKIQAKTITVKASRQLFSDYTSEGSASGGGEDMSTTVSSLGTSTTSTSTGSLSPDSGSGDAQSILPSTGSDLGSGINKEEINVKAEGRLYNLKKPEKVVEKQDPEQHKGHSTPGWIIIVGFIVGVAALVVLCLAIATRDKWNGPRQASTTKTESNPLNQQKGLEMETFLPGEEPRENGKAAEYTVIPLDELSESYS
ncbi:uncharacterized protein LOC111588880 isoform X2 [Amphiprion ocellaris]|uniref:uncharacterized protein LOC111588880 isoform X2 n=1 Tax=Amphiprion ocellaris TaxID=80972 RepID=UPI002410FEEC|nr:uncharacterized protein LOC111588880 isoform X2 [Amphiprion ocellaris]